MDLASTRLALHGAVELLLAGPQHAVSDTVRLRALPTGIATTKEPDLRIEGLELVAPSGRHRMAGTYAEVAAAAGIAATRLDDVYEDGSGVGPDDLIELDADHLETIVAALGVGDAALRAFAPDEAPVLWPEHFDVGISVGEVNYGVSAGDSTIPEPYAYVGPWTPRSGQF